MQSMNNIKPQYSTKILILMKTSCNNDDGVIIIL